MAITLPRGQFERVMARMLCDFSHPLAVNMGWVPPLVRCCSECTLYPAGHPTTWTFPA